MRRRYTEDQLKNLIAKHWTAPTAYDPLGQEWTEEVRAEDLELMNLPPEGLEVVVMELDWEEAVRRARKACRPDSIVRERVSSKMRMMKSALGLDPPAHIIEGEDGGVLLSWPPTEHHRHPFVSFDNEGRIEKAKIIIDNTGE